MIFQIGKPRGRQQVEDNGEPNLSSQSDEETGNDSANESELEPVQENSPPKVQPKGKLIRQFFLVNNSQKYALKS